MAGFRNVMTAGSPLNNSSTILKHNESVFEEESDGLKHESSVQFQNKFIQ